MVLLQNPSMFVMHFMSVPSISPLNPSKVGGSLNTHLVPMERLSGFFSSICVGLLNNNHLDIACLLYLTLNIILKESFMVTINGEVYNWH